MAGAPGQGSNTPRRPHAGEVRTTLAPAWMPRQARGVRFDARLAVLPLSFVVLLFLGVVARVPFPVIAALAVLVPVVFVLLWRAARARHAAFERDVGLLLHRGDLDAIEDRLADGLMRFFIDPGALLPREGLVLLLRGDLQAAERTLEAAWELARPEHRVDLLGPLCRVKYRLGNFGEMKELAEEWVPRERFGTAARVYLAFGLLEWAQPDPGRAEALLGEVAVDDLEPDDAAVYARVMQRLWGDEAT